MIELDDLEVIEAHWAISMSLWYLKAVLCEKEGTNIPAGMNEKLKRLEALYAKLDVAEASIKN